MSEGSVCKAKTWTNIDMPLKFHIRTHQHRTHLSIYEYTSCCYGCRIHLTSLPVVLYAQWCIENVCVCLYLNTSLPLRPFIFFKFIYLPVRYSNGVRLLPNFQWLHCTQSQAAFEHVWIVLYRLHEKIYQHLHQGHTNTIK